MNELFGMCAKPPLRLRIIAYDFHTHPVVYKRSVRCPSGNCAAEINGIRFDGMP